MSLFFSFFFYQLSQLLFQVYISNNRRLFIIANATTCEGCTMRTPQMALLAAQNKSSYTAVSTGCVFF